MTAEKAPGGRPLFPSGTASAPPHRVESIWIVFRPWPALAPLLDLPEAQPGVGRLSLADHPHREAIVAAYRSLLHWTRTPGPLSDRLAENALERAWLLAVEAHRRRDPLPDERLRPVLEHIDAHFDEPLTVEALARAASLSPSRFAHRFREAMGVPPMAYVEALRMEEAKSLLLATNLPVKAVARRLGFDNPFHFSTRFRKCTGCSPTAFREAPDAAINRGVSPRHHRRSPSARGTP